MNEANHDGKQLDLVAVRVLSLGQGEVSGSGVRYGHTRRRVVGGVVRPETRTYGRTECFSFINW
jgi:hypothetical protein